MPEQSEMQEVRALLQDLTAKVHALPTRDELALFLTKEVFSIEMETMRREIDEMKKHPADTRMVISFVLNIVLALIAVVSFLAAHWRP